MIMLGMAKSFAGYVLAVKFELGFFALSFTEAFLQG